MRCNIDARGRLARLICGILVLLAAVAVLLLSFIGTLEAWWWLIGALLLLVAGAFQIFEARAGWCVMCAMGFKTPM